MCTATNTLGALESIDRLKDAEGYPLWKFQIEIYLEAADLLDIVQSETKAAHSESAEWKRRDAKAKRMIVSTLEKQSLIHIVTCLTSYEMWQKLRGIYERDSQHQKCALMQEFFEYKKKSNIDIATYITELKNLAFKLKSLGEEINDTMIMSKILSALPENYRFFSSAWESTPAGERTVENLTARLLAEEARNRSDKEEEVAFKAEERKCYKCNMKGHLAHACKKVDNTKKHDVKCFNCRKIGHMAKDCKRDSCKICKKTNHSEKDCFFRNKKKGDPERDEKNKIAFLTSTEETEDWIVDSGSTSHMTNDSTKLKEGHKIITKVGVANKEGNMVARKTGTVDLGNCELNNVLYIPDLRKNLLSVGAITQKGGKVEFYKNEVIISKDKKTIFKGKRNSAGLYVVQNDVITEKAMTTEIKSSVKLWHERLGHLGPNNMIKLLKLSEGIKLKKCEIQEQLSNCETCTQANHTRMPFGDQRKRATRPLEIIHTDVCGPISPETWDRNRYFVTFLDDYTNYVVVYLMEKKGEVVEKLKEFISQAEVKQRKKVVEIRCDNGKEYSNTELKTWCKIKGTSINYTPPYTPQLNGKAERLNRTLIEKTRAMIKGAEENKALWGEAVRVAAYLHNRSPTKATTKTAYEMWNGTRPNLKHLRVFGCTAYAKELGQLRKLDNRSKIVKFIGYTQTGYRLWDPIKRKIVISREVRFKEKEDITEEEDTKNTREEKKNQNKYMRDSEDSEEDKEISSDDEEDKKSEEEDPEEDPEEEEDDDEEDKTKKTDDNIKKQTEDTPRRSQRPKKIPERYNTYAYLTYEEAMKSKDKRKWMEAMKEEKKSLKKNKTWELVEVNETKGKKCLTSRWVLQKKENGKFKARLVARGCEQGNNIDYEELYSPVVNSAALRIMFALAAHYKWKFIKFDVKTAFLYGELEDEIFMYLPEGFQEEKNKVCKLLKALYGLKQASNRWNKKFTKTLKKYGLEQLCTDKCIFKKKDNSAILAIHVDDGIIFGENMQDLKDLLAQLEDVFEITFNNDPSSFLGIQIKQGREGIKLNQQSYSEKILETYGMLNSKPVDTPILANAEINDGGSKTKFFPFREAVGSLLYLTAKTRPDLSYAVTYNSRNTQNPSDVDVINIKRILRYVQGTKHLGIAYNSDENVQTLRAYCDADYAGDVKSRKSTSGYIIELCGGPISWASRKQPIVALSSTEAEFISAADCCKELLFLKSMLEEITGKVVNAEMHVDNQSAIKLIKSGVFNRRSKHIDVRFHFISEKVKENNISIVYCNTSDQIADIFTKPLGAIKFRKFRDMLVQ